MNIRSPFSLAALLFATAQSPAQSQDFVIDWHSLNPGGSSHGGNYVLNGGVEPLAAASVTGGDFTVESGFWSIPAATSDITTLIVPGTANPWLAGMTNGFQEAHGDVTPDESPVLFKNFSAGARLQFAASGSASYGGAPSGPTGSPGVVNHGAEDGIGAIANAPPNALIGVFLDDAQPDAAAPTPDALDFGSADIRNYAEIHPALKQPFYIGSGTNVSGLQQSVIAPAGATRLFLGIQDGFGWYNNSGSFTVIVMGVGSNAGAASFDRNLILNSSAEDGPGSTSSNDVLPVPNWTTSHNFTVAVYNPDFPSPGAAFGKNYFSGGPALTADASNPFSSATQMIDVSPLSAEIDGVRVMAELSGFFGGFESQDDRASLTASFLDAAGRNLGSTFVGNVLAADRANRTVLLYRGATNAVPVGTRAIQVALNMTNAGGFYYNDAYADNLSLVLRNVAPGNASVTLFDNTTGSDNGGGGVTETTWLAGKFCMGAQSFSLDSLSLLLNSQDFSGAAGPPSAVRLQIYSHDSLKNKPLASTAVVMNLADLTNPVTPPHGYGLVKWVPATPFQLEPNTCYWAVLSRESGGNIGEIASATAPTGPAAAFGATRSIDAGQTWGVADPGYNHKMLITGTPVSASGAPADLAVDSSTPIPGGSGSFQDLPYPSALSEDYTAFFGTGSGGQQGIYLQNKLTGASKVADLTTPIPNGSGSFVSFGQDAGIIIVGGDVLFKGLGSGAQKGLYLAQNSAPGKPVRIVDTSVAMPNGTGTFSDFLNAPAFNGTALAFVATGSAGQSGLYKVAAISPPQIGAPALIADTTTAIPAGTGNFTAFPSAPALLGNDVAFIGNGSAGQQGLYKVAAISPPQVGPLKIADTTTPIPNGTGNFTAFGPDQAHPIDPAASSDRLAFVGSGSGGQQGVYTVEAISPPQTGPLRIADTTTPVPEGSGNFASFGAVAVSETDVAFLGRDSAGRSGIYDANGGGLVKVVAMGDKIGTKTISGLNFSRAGLFGDPITFQATFTDGSDGIFTVNVPRSSELRITSIETVGQDIRISFDSRAGKSYIIQSRDAFGGQTWRDNPSPAIRGTGGPVQITLPNAISSAQQFFRAVEEP